MAGVLIADDDPVFREVTRVALESAGHTVTVARDGLEALQLATDPAVHLVVVDIYMPEKDGLEVIIELRQTNPCLRIIAVSAGKVNGRGDHLRTASVFGAHATLTKPLDLHQLLDLVDRLGDGRPSHSDFRR